MTTNQTIDGELRELLERILSYTWFPSGDVSVFDLRLIDREQLRDLLDAPVVESQIPQYFVGACDKFDWAPEEALRFYAEGKHFDTDKGQTRILCTGAIASLALKGLGEGYAAMKGIEPDAQPQGEPAGYRDPSQRWATIKADNKAKMEADGHDLSCFSVPLYAEQPAPVAVIMPECLPGDDGVCTESHYASGWNACLDELKRLNPSL